MKKNRLYHMRKEYSPHSLNIEQLKQDPYEQFHLWFQEALKSEPFEANAMILSTISSSNTPSSRVVLLKSYSSNGFLFFTNYHSKKGRDLESNPNLSLLFYWPATMRQIRIEGVAKRVEEAESDRYFSERPIQSKASSALSLQSQPLADRERFEREVERVVKSEAEILRPSHWGGYNVTPNSFEFWQGGVGRSHSRFSYTKAKSGWRIEELYP